MEDIFWRLLTFITKAIRAVLALFYIMWKFELNPIIEEGKHGCYPCSELDYKLWDWVLLKARKTRPTN